VSNAPSLMRKIKNLTSSNSSMIWPTLSWISTLMSTTDLLISILKSWEWLLQVKTFKLHSQVSLALVLIPNLSLINTNAHSYGSSKTRVLFLTSWSLCTPLITPAKVPWSNLEAMIN
jgi:hypothetical protein